MATCEKHVYYSGPFCSGCDQEGGPNAAKNEGYKPFNETREFGQNQYASRYITGTDGKPNLGEGLRFKGDVSDYHSLYIHQDDEEEFRKRFQAHLKQLEEGE